MTKWDGGPFLTLCIDTKAEEHHESVARSLVSPNDNNSKLMYGPYAAGTDCYATNLVAGKMSLVLYIRLRVEDTIRIVVAPSTFSQPNDERWLSCPVPEVPSAVLWVHVFLLACVRRVSVESRVVRASITLETWDDAETLPSSGCFVHPFIRRAIFAESHIVHTMGDVIEFEVVKDIFTLLQFQTRDPSSRMSNVDHG